MHLFCLLYDISYLHMYLHKGFCILLDWLIHKVVVFLGSISTVILSFLFRNSQISLPLIYFLLSLVRMNAANLLYFEITDTLT